MSTEPQRPQVDQTFQMERAWRLALIADDASAIKVAVAYYTLKPKQRDDLDKLRDLSGISSPIRPILTRLEAAGMLIPTAPEPPPVLVRLIATFVSRAVTAR